MKWGSKHRACALLTLIWVLRSACAGSALFGIHMNNVAVKVVELAASSRDSVLDGLDFSASGDQIAVGADEGVAIWDWRQSRLVNTLQLPQGEDLGQTTSPLRYSPDGKFLAICGTRASGNVVARVWNTSDWSIAKDITDPGGGGCSALAFSTDGRTFVTLMDRWGGPGEQLIVYEVGTWRKLWGHTFPQVSPVSLAMSPDGGVAAIGGLLRVAPSAAEVPDPVKRAQQSYQEPYIYLVDLRRREVIRDIRADAMGPMAWSSDGSRIAVVGREYVEIFAAGPGQRLVHQELTGSTHMNVLFTPGDRYFIESDMNARGTGLGVHIWDAGRQKTLQTMPDNADSIAVSQNGKYLAIAVDGRTTIWELK